MKDEPEQEDDERDDERGHGDVIRKVPASQKRLAHAGKIGSGREKNIPRHWQEKLVLDLDKRRKDANDGACRDQHDQHPQVQLDRWPVILVDALDAALVDERARGYRRRGHCCFVLPTGVVSVGFGGFGGFARRCAPLEDVPSRWGGVMLLLLLPALAVVRRVGGSFRTLVNTNCHVVVESKKMARNGPSRPGGGVRSWGSVCGPSGLAQMSSESFNVIRLRLLWMVVSLESRE